jgi:hypothetical protein
MAEGSDENYRNRSQDSQSPVKDSNPGRPEYEEGVLHFRVIPNPFITNSEYMHCLGTVPSAPTNPKNTCIDFNFVQVFYSHQPQIISFFKHCEHPIYSTDQS